MSTNSTHFPKYPYQNESFHQRQVNFLNQFEEIKPDLEPSKRTEKQIKTVSQNAAPENQVLEAKVFNLIDNIVRFGSKKVLPNSNRKLGKEVLEQLEDIYDAIELDIENINAADDGTAVENDADFELGPVIRPGKDLSLEESSHGKGLVLNFLRDFILERNYLSQTPENSFEDLSGAQWNTASVSITGSHTEAINSDSVTETKASSRVLGTVADGISNMINPQDMGDFISVKKGIRNGSLPKEQAQKKLNEIYDRDTYSYGSHYLASALTQNIANTPELDSLVMGVDLESRVPLKANALDASKTLKESPAYFWDFFEECLSSGLEIDNDPNQNFYQNFADAIESEALIKNHIENEIPGFSEAIKHPDTQIYLTAIAPLFIAKNEIEKDFADKFQGHPNDVNGGAQLTYAMDLGTKIALVRIGDAPIKAFSKEGDLIDQKKNIDSDLEENIMGSIHINYDSLSNQAELSLSRTPYIEIINKDDANTILMSSDGVFDETSYAKSLKTLARRTAPLIEDTNDSREIVSQLLKQVSKNDDRTMLVLKQS